MSLFDEPVEERFDKEGMYFNNEVLIFDGKKYTSVYEENAELIET